MPQTSTRKLYEHLQPVLPDIKVKNGQGRLFELQRDKGMLIRKTKQFHVKTNSNHSFYTSPNLLKDIEITHKLPHFNRCRRYRKRTRKRSKR